MEAELNAESVACEHPKNAVIWNEFNGVAQCHHCGWIDGVATYVKGHQDGFARITEAIQALIEDVKNTPIPLQSDGSEGAAALGATPTQRFSRAPSDPTHSDGGEHA